MKMSVITVCYNSGDTIADTIASVAGQTHPDIEHILIDGGSTDNTMAVVQRHAHRFSHVVSEPDQGIYDAMNKGIDRAGGEVVGMLNADDLYYDACSLSAVANIFDTEPVDAVCGDLVYVAPGNLSRTVRFYPASGFSPWMFSFGMMPPHPAVFIRRRCYETLGRYRTDYRIAADFELLVRFLRKARIPYTCLPRILVKMRTGGISNRDLNSARLLNREVLRACRENQVPTSVFHLTAKYGIKLAQLFRRPGRAGRMRHRQGVGRPAGGV